MTTPIGFERWEPGHPWGDVLFADGTRTSVPDPDGSIESQARDFGARYNAKPQEAAPAPQPPLTGAAAMPPQVSTPAPDVPPGPPLPSGKPLSATERAPLEPSPQDLQALSAPPAPGMPSTAQSPTAAALASHGIDPNSLPRRAPAGAAPAPPTGAGVNPDSPTLAALQQHAPDLVQGLAPKKATIGTEGPDAETAANVHAGSNAALDLRGQAINESMDAKGQNLQDEAGRANQAFFDAKRARMAALGDEAAATQARVDAASRLAQAKQLPIADHPDFPDWFVGASILGGIAGGFAEGFSGGRYKSTTVQNLQEITRNWIDNQRNNKGQLVSSLEQQLGDKDAALLAAHAKVSGQFANEAEAQARFARTTEGMRELKSTADTLRAESLEKWDQAQAVVMGKNKTDVALEKPVGEGVAPNDVVRKYAALGYKPEQIEKGLDKKIGGESGPTLNEAIDRVRRIDTDAATLKSLAAANGNIPNRGVIHIPAQLVGPLAKLGIKQGMAAEEVQQIYKRYLVQGAKAMGSRVTDKELEISGETLGESTQGLFRALKLIRDETNDGISRTAEAAFPGAAQKVLTIHRNATAATPGVAEVQVDPFEVENTNASDEARVSAEEAKASQAEIDAMDPERKALYYRRLADEEKRRKDTEHRAAARKDLEAQPAQQERARLPLEARYPRF